EYDNFQLLRLGFEPGWGSARGKGRRLSPLPLAQLCRSLLLAPRQTLAGFCIPSCYADGLRCTPFATPRSSAGRRTGSETSSPSSTHLAAVRENFQSAHF